MLNVRGMCRKMLTLFRKVYSKVTAAVCTREGLTKLFDCKLGVRQGCMLHPRLFMIFTSKPEKLLKKSKHRGITMGNVIEVYLLMYADDIVLVGDTVLELQTENKYPGDILQKVGMELKLWFSEMAGKHLSSIAKKCFDICCILKMATVKSVEPGNNYFSINHIIRCRSKLLPLGFPKVVLILIL